MNLSSVYSGIKNFLPTKILTPGKHLRRRHLRKQWHGEDNFRRISRSLGFCCANLHLKVHRLGISLCSESVSCFLVVILIIVPFIDRAFVENNYKNLKTLNPKFPILIRECSGTEPQLWARYGALFLYYFQ